MTGYQSKKKAASAKTIDEVNWADHEPDGRRAAAQDEAAFKAASQKQFQRDYAGYAIAAAAQPTLITFNGGNAEWVMRITADRRIEVNEGVEVSEAAQKVLDALQNLLRPAQEPVCPACKAEVLYECVACSSNNYPPQPAQEPVGKFAKFTDGIWREVTDGSAGVSLYTAPQRPWVGLTDEEIALIDWESLVTKKDCVRAVEAKLLEKNA